MMKKQNTSERLKEYMSITGNRQIDIFNKALPIAQALGQKISKANISQYVSGKIEPKQDKIFIIAEALEISPAWLMGLDVPMEKQTESKQLPLNENERGQLSQDVIQYLCNLTDEEMSKVDSFVQWLLANRST